MWDAYRGRRALDLVLEALPGIHAVTNVRLVLIGEGHLRRRLERAAHDEPAQLRVLPFETDRARLARAYASADLYVAPCPYETFGLAALEAMASGLPVVGVGAAGVGRLLAHADWGRTYRVGDAGDCARAMRELPDARPAGRGGPARALVVERYGWDRTFSALLALYEDVAARRSPRSAAPAKSSAPSAAGSISV